jgi:Salmonella virulence plasmid 65kDa B protein
LLTCFCHLPANRYQRLGRIKRYSKAFNNRRSNKPLAMEKDTSYSPNKSPSENTSGNKSSGGYSSTTAPQISLPKGGGSIKSIDKKFSLNAANGTSGCSIPFLFSPSRNGFMPGMSQGYSHGSGNDIFGLGWNAQPTAIVRRTDKQLLQCSDGNDS